MEVGGRLPSERQEITMVERIRLIKECEVDQGWDCNWRSESPWYGGVMVK